MCVIIKPEDMDRTYRIYHIGHLGDKNYLRTSDYSAIARFNRAMAEDLINSLGNARKEYHIEEISE